MSVSKLEYAEPFFGVDYVVDEVEYRIEGARIVLNVSETPLQNRDRPLGFFRSAIMVDTCIRAVARCFVISRFDAYDDEDALFEAIRARWTLVYEATGLERHRGVQLWRSPKEKLGDIEANMCYAASIPLNVGLHRTHWGELPFKEVHTQILGYGSIRRYAEQELNTLYREDRMAPGVTHEPMYDEKCVYPWHQYETITRAVFQATELQLTEEEYRKI